MVRNEFGNRWYRVCRRVYDSMLYTENMHLLLKFIFPNFILVHGFFRKTKCPLWGSNSRPSDYETDALTNCAKKASGNDTWPLVPKSNDLGLVLKSVLKVKSGLWWNKIYFWKKLFFLFGTFWTDLYFSGMYMFDPD